MLHVQGEVVNESQINIRGNSSKLQHLQEMCGVCFQNGQVVDEVKCRLNKMNLVFITDFPARETSPVSSAFENASFGEFQQILASSGD
jgi:hypothetical protein